MNGLNTGAGSQAALAQNNMYQQGVAALGAAEANANNDLNKSIADTKEGLARNEQEALQAEAKKAEPAVEKPSAGVYTEPTTPKGEKENDSVRRDSNNDQLGTGRQPGGMVKSDNIRSGDGSEAPDLQEKRSRRAEDDKENDSSRAGTGKQNGMDSGDLQVESKDGGDRTVSVPVSGETDAGVTEKQDQKKPSAKEQHRKERTAENNKRMKALELHFGKRGLVSDPKKNMHNIAAMRDFGLRTLTKIFGGDNGKAMDFLGRYTAFLEPTYEGLFNSGESNP